MRRALTRSCAAAALLALSGGGLTADPSLTTYGTPGLVEMPSAEVLAPGELAFAASVFGPNDRYTGTFQFLPRVYGSFRYSIIEGFNGPVIGNRYDRSFDLHLQLIEENARMPALAFGLRDFLGTGIYSSEYLVATKHLGSRLKVTGGLGWGRLAGRGGFDNPLGVIDDRFETRPGRGDRGNTGGQVEARNWLRGDAAFFGGLAWQMGERTTLFAEYSSDIYDEEEAKTDMKVGSGLNLGIEHRFRNNLRLKGFVIGGEEIGAQLSYVLDPARRVVPGGAEGAPPALGARERLAAASWNDPAQGGGPAALEKVLAHRLAEEGLVLQGFSTSATAASIRIENRRWDVEAQAAGRAARVMAAVLPPRIEQFSVVFQQRGVPVSRVVSRRSDLEELADDYDGAWRTRARAGIEDAADQPRGDALPDAFPQFSYGLSPYLALSFFDPDSPVRADVGAQLSLAYQPSPGLTFAGRFRYPLAGNIDKADRPSDSVIARVRTDVLRYAQESDVEINNLTAEYLFRPGPDLFGRVTAGYLEDMYGGVSGELLWYPVASSLALGAELNYARQRDFDMRLGFQDYDVITGHASAYYDFGNGFLGQIDAGRYLAG
ncbi:YjbH domain-containing protein, partial [Sulfitobacter aestuarii]